MKYARGWLGTLFVCAMLVVFLTYIGVSIFPFYTSDPLYKVTQKVHRAGDDVEICFSRKSQISIPAKVVRELIRVEKTNGDLKYFEIQKVAWDVYFEKGARNMCVYYELPVDKQLTSGNYKYIGSATYVPFGLVTREEPFETELFTVE